MKIRDYDPANQKMLRKRAQTETQYLVAQSGHGWTTDLEQARGWARHRAQFTSRPVPVLTRTVTYSKWTVADEQSP